jgi:flagellar hook-associated protein 3 FlgL
MRVTNNMMISNLNNYLEQRMEALDKYNQQLSEGKKIRFPHEDPIIVQRSLSFYSTLESNDQYQKNIQHAQDWLINTETAVNDGLQVLQRVRELALKGGNDTNSQASKDAIAAEIEQLNEHLLQIANTKVAGKYLFSGASTDIKPFASLTGDFSGNVGSEMVTEINSGIIFSYNINGEEIFGQVSDSTTFNLLSDLSEALNNSEEVGGFISELDDRIDQFMVCLSDIGAKTNRLELSGDRLSAENLNLNTLLSRNEDVDIAEAITNLKMEETVYRSALAVGARIIQPSLIDFIK